MLVLNIVKKHVFKNLYNEYIKDITLKKWSNIKQQLELKTTLNLHTQTEFKYTSTQIDTRLDQHKRHVGFWCTNHLDPSINTLIFYLPEEKEILLQTFPPCHKFHQA